MGIPAYKQTSTCDHKDLWEAQLRLATSSVPWVEIMGRSVHSVEIDVKLPKYVWDLKKINQNWNILTLSKNVYQTRSSGDEVKLSDRYLA